MADKRKQAEEKRRADDAKKKTDAKKKADIAKKTPRETPRGADVHAPEASRRATVEGK
jgi:hypothetical protein